jgi:putative two-component system response regulator
LRKIIYKTYVLGYCVKVVVRVVKNILIVDDNFETTYTVKDGLEDLDVNYYVTCADSGRKCLELLETHPIPHLILLDIMMPEMNGWELFKILKENAEWKKIPVVFLTAKTDSYSKGQGKLLAQDYIEKPFEITNLKSRIDKVLEKSSPVSETKERIVDDYLSKLKEVRN